MLLETMQTHTKADFCNKEDLWVDMNPYTLRHLKETYSLNMSRNKIEYPRVKKIEKLKYRLSWMFWRNQELSLDVYHWLWRQMIENRTLPGMNSPVTCIYLSDWFPLYDSLGNPTASPPHQAPRGQPCFSLPIQDSISGIHVEHSVGLFLVEPHFHQSLWEPAWSSQSTLH